MKTAKRTFRCDFKYFFCSSKRQNKRFDKESSSILFALKVQLKEARKVIQQQKREASGTAEIQKSKRASETKLKGQKRKAN